MGLKTDQSEFIRVSRIKSSQWKSLLSDFQIIIGKLKNIKKQMISEDYINKDSSMENGKLYCSLYEINKENTYTPPKHVYQKLHLLA